MKSAEWICFPFFQKTDDLQLGRKSMDSLKGLHGLQNSIQISSLARSAPAPHLSGFLADHLQTTENANPPDYLSRIWSMIPGSSRFAPCLHRGDRTLQETIVNVLTSIPFIVLGIRAPRKRTSEKLYASSLIGVGVVSSIYHVSRGDRRKNLRWADQMMIAASSICLSTALGNNSRVLMSLSAAVLPFRPVLVSTFHTGMMEVNFARRASSEQELRRVRGIHTAAIAVAGTLFVADDIFPDTPYIHAAWHLAAATAVATVNKLLG